MIEHGRPEDWKGPLFDLLNPLTVLLMEEHINRNVHAAVVAAGYEVLKVENLTGDGLFKLIVARRPPDPRYNRGL